MAGDPGRVSRVRRTGLALVHEGEWVVAGPNGAAGVADALAEERSVVEYHFPVEIEVVSGGSAVDTDALVDLTLARLAEHLEGLA